MFAMDHAATALLLARRYPRVPMPALLLSVQLMELVWVALDLLGIERSSADASAHTVANIHLSYMPYSHSVATMGGAALLAAGVAWTVTRRRDLAAAMGLGIVSHLALDVLVHAPDLTLAPGLPSPRLGLGLYSGAPWAAFVVEVAYGVLCWRIFRGSRALLAVIVSFNLANASMFFAALPGPEELLPDRPLLLPLLVLAQIAATLVLTGIFARRSARSAQVTVEPVPA